MQLPAVLWVPHPDLLRHAKPVIFQLQMCLLHLEKDIGAFYTQDASKNPCLT